MIIQRCAVFLWALVALLLSPLLAHAGQEQRVWEEILLWVLTLIGTIAAPVISLLLITLLRKKGLAVNQEMVSKIVELAVGYAEQTAAKALKADAPKTESAAKLSSALDFASAQIKAHKLPELAIEQLIKLIEAKLGSQKL